MSFALIPLYIVILIFGCVVGSFLNVLIFRIPKGEEFVKTRSHCMTCGYQLKWYDLIPIISYLSLGGKCRKCKTKLSAQYPIIEISNGLLWVLAAIFTITSDLAYEGLITWILVALMFSALLALSVIDGKTKEIPFGFNVFIFILGVIRTILDSPIWLGVSNWYDHLIGMVSVSLVLLIILLVSGGRAIGGGDVKLMFAAGLFLGWQGTVMAFFLGCIFGSIIHIVRMKVSGAEKQLAMGPYLSGGIVVAALFGDEIINLLFM